MTPGRPAATRTNRLLIGAVGALCTALTVGLLSGPAAEAAPVSTSAINVVGAVALLFCAAFSAYATAAALTNGTLSITPLAISSALSGNVLVGQENVGYALAFDMVVVVVPLTVLYQYMQRRTSRWLA